MEQIKKLSRNGTGQSDQTDQVRNQPFVYRDHIYFVADSASGFARPERVTFVNGELGLWRTDGTEAGTIPVTELISGVETLLSAVELNDRMLLTLETESGVEYWAFDGTTIGTEQLLLEPPFDSVVVGDRLFFADETELGSELHVTDGTVAGTAMLADLVDGSSSSSPHDFFQFGDRVFFQAVVDVDDGSEALWSSDGTAEGTHVVFDQPILDSVVVGDDLYFTSAVGLHRITTGSDVVAFVLDEPNDIKFTASTDYVLLYEVGEETYSVGDASLSPVAFEPPLGRVVLSNSDHIVYAVQETRTIPEMGDRTINETTIEFVATDGTVGGTRSLAAPFAHQDDSFQGYPVSFIGGVQDFGEKMLVTIRNDGSSSFDGREELLVYAIDLVENPKLPGDANEDGVVGFDDFLT